MNDIFSLDKRNLNVPKVVSKLDVYNINETALPLFEQFNRTKPCCSKFGEDGMIMLRDAVESYLRYTFDTLVTTNLDINEITDQCIKYARIYYRSADIDTRSGILQLLRSRIGDILRQYKKSSINTSATLENLINNFYEGIKLIIESGDG